MLRTVIKNTYKYYVKNIQKDDGLPQKVCMRCAGTLEFLCDFHDQCQLMQRKLALKRLTTTGANIPQEDNAEPNKENTVPEAVNYKLVPQNSDTKLDGKDAVSEADDYKLVLQDSNTESDKGSAVPETVDCKIILQKDSDAESDKENTVPEAVDCKRKGKAIFLETSKIMKDSSVITKTLPIKYEVKDEISSSINNSNISSNTENDELIQSNSHISVNTSNNFTDNRTSKIAEMLVNAEAKENVKKNNIGTLKCEKSLHAKRETCVVKKVTSEIRTEIKNNVSGSTNKEKNKIVNDVDENSDNSSKRQRRVKNMHITEIKNAKSMALSPSTKEDLKRKSMDNHLAESDSSANVSTKYLKRNHFHVICTDNNPNVNELEQSLSVVSQKQDTVKEQSLNAAISYLEESLTVNKIKNARKQNAINSKNVKKNNVSDAKTIIQTVKSKAVSVIVKQEKSEVNDILPRVALPSNLNECLWKTNAMSLRQPQKPKIQENVSSNTSPPPGDEAELGQGVNVNQLRTTVIKSFSKTVTSDMEVNSAVETLNERKDLDVDSRSSSSSSCSNSSNSSMNLSQRLSRRSKAKEGTFGKVSELISDEQKKIIETHYIKDMSIVNSTEVTKNLKIVDKKKITCNICGRVYSRMDKCQVHIWSHLEMKPYKCKICDFSTVTISNVRCHIRKSHLKIKPFKCHLCVKKYVTAVLLEEHLNTHTGARPFKCKICNFASSSRQVLSYHSATHKPVKDIHCNVCGKEFYSKSRMRAHVLIHNKDKAIMCKVCSTYLSNAAALEQHMTNVHTRDYICDICGKCLKSRKTLLNHKNVHADAKYKCHLCPNVYKSSHILKEHILKHEGIRKYKCSICEKSFAQQSHLAAHMAVHSDKRYYCPGCDRAFNRQDNMKIHTKRCNLFLANPELKDFFIKQKRMQSLNKKIDVSLLTNNCEDTISEAVEKQNKTDVSIGEPAGTSFDRSAFVKEQEDECKVEHPEDVQDNEETILKVIPVTHENDACITMNDDNITIEKVLTHEYF